MIYKKELVDHLCGYFGTTVEELRKRNRKPEFVLKRYMILAYLVNHTTLSSAGDVFGFDHATVSHAKKTVSNLLEIDKRFPFKWNDFCIYANIFFNNIDYKEVNIYFVKGVPTIDLNNKITSFDSIELAKAYIDGIRDGMEIPFKDSNKQLKPIEVAEDCIFLIEKENKKRDGYELFGYKSSEQEAKDFCEEWGYWTDDGVSIGFQPNKLKTRFRYTKIPCLHSDIFDGRNLTVK